MYKLIIMILVGVLLYFTYAHFSDLKQQKLEHEITRQQFQSDKKDLKTAREANSLEALNRFIKQHPDSEWLESAKYYRDKLKVSQLLDSGDITEMARFIDQNPNSAWRNQVQQRLKKIKREHENALAEKRAAEKRATQKEMPSQSVQAKSSPTIKSNYPYQETNPVREKGDTSQDRVKRALSIYQKMNKQKQRETDNKTRQQENDDKLSRNCYKLKDQIKHYSQRIRWYELDEEGNRVYIKKDVITKRKQEMQRDYDEYCR